MKSTAKGRNGRLLSATSLASRMISFASRTSVCVGTKEAVTRAVTLRLSRSSGLEELTCRAASRSGPRRHARPQAAPQGDRHRCASCRTDSGLGSEASQCLPSILIIREVNERSHTNHDSLIELLNLLGVEKFVKVSLKCRRAGEHEQAMST